MTRVAEKLGTNINSYISPLAVVRDSKYFDISTPVLETHSPLAHQLLSDVLQPYFKNYGKPTAQIEGVYIPQVVPSPIKKFTLVDFSDARGAALNASSLLAISAALQGSRVSVSKKYDKWGIPEDKRPLEYSQEFKNKIDAWLSGSEDMAKRTDFHSASKKLFYSIFSEMITIVLRNGTNPTEAFNYFASYDAQTNRKGFGLYKRFFPAISKKIDESAISSLLKGGRSFDDAIRGFVDHKPQDFYDIESALELAFLLQFPPSIKDTLIGFADKGIPLQIDWSLSKEKVIEQINGMMIKFNSAPETPPEIGKRPEIKTRSLPLPEQFGLERNDIETEMMQTFYGHKNAVVISPEQIRKNPRNFHNYQRALVLKIAENDGIPLSSNIELPIPKEYKTEVDSNKREKQIELFRKTEKLLKEKSDWAWILLIPELQEKYFKALPYVSVPPYVLINGQAVPVFNKEHNKTIMRLIKEDPSCVINQLPSFNHIEMKTHQILLNVNPHRSLTIVGKFLQEVLNKGGTPYIDHGMARWILEEWKSTVPLDSHAYSLWSGSDATIAPPIDVDMLIFGLQDNALAPIAQKLVADLNMHHGEKGRSLLTSYLLGRTMSKTKYTHITKQTQVNSTVMKFIRTNPYLAAHDQGCIMQALEAWQAGETAYGTNLLLETIVGFSKMRGFGVIPEVISEPNVAYGIAVKAVDPLGGLTQHVEAGGGVDIGGVRRNIVQFFDLDRAFPENQTYSIWHMLRTLSELIYTKNGAVIYPEGSLSIYNDQTNGIEQMKIGVEQLYTKMRKVTHYLNKIRRGQIPIDNIVKVDLRREIRKTGRGLIEADLEKFLILSSSKDEVDEKKAIIGIEMSRFFPHLDLLRENKIVWTEIMKKVKKNEKKQDESNLAFLTRIILEMDCGVDIMSLVVKSIQEDFLKDPVRVGNKLVRYDYNSEIEQSELLNGNVIHADWAALDFTGIGKYALFPNTVKWLKLLKKLEAGEIDIRDEFFELDRDLFKAIDKHALWKKPIENMSISLTSPVGKMMQARKVNAFADWLLDEGL